MAELTIYDEDGETIRKRDARAWSIPGEDHGGIYVHLNSPGEDGTLGSGIVLTELELAGLGWVRI